MSKDTIKSDYLVFVIEVDQAQKLTLEIFDDGSFVMVADCTFSVNTGGNFLAVDVKNINKGVYNFRLKDEEGSEVNKRVVLSKKARRGINKDNQGYKIETVFKIMHAVVRN